MCTHTPLHEPFSTCATNSSEQPLVTHSQSINPSGEGSLLHIPSRAQKDKNLHRAASCVLNHTDHKYLVWGAKLKHGNKQHYRSFGSDTGKH